MARVKLNGRIYTHPQRVNFGVTVDFMPGLFGIAIFMLMWEIWLEVNYQEGSDG